MALGLLVSAAVLFHVGTADAFNALAYGGRVVGVAFVAAALVEAVAALAVCDYRRGRLSRLAGTAPSVPSSPIFAYAQGVIRRELGRRRPHRRLRAGRRSRLPETDPRVVNQVTVRADPPSSDRVDRGRG
ncbi:hypothetical protein [Streptomyces sp. NPDC002172]